MPLPQIIEQEDHIITDKHLGLDLITCHNQGSPTDLDHLTSAAMRHHNFSPVPKSQQNARAPNQVRQQFGPRNYKRTHLSSSLSGDGSNIPLFKGLINNCECLVMRDTGCSISAASATKVFQSQMTNKKVKCTLINGQTITQSTAIVDVITPFYEGRIEVLVFTNCVADLILRNDIDPNTHSKIQMLGNEIHDDGSEGDGCSKHVTALVTTRSQNAKIKDKDKPIVTDSEKKTTNNTKSTSNNNYARKIKRLWEIL